ncbi:hypothetical protein AB4Y89_02870 [Terriglobus sp. 2YAB30_2]|uniref:hypothetical protein n=1 Tax=Terriglobus sp. 2YAB30_2 TaxID=3233023 RepID=UPI003F9E1A9A
MMVTSVGPSLGDATAIRQQKLENAAKQFEGMLMNELLKPLRNEEDGEGQFGDALKSYGTEALATAMASRGGLGFGSKMVAAVEQREKDSVTSSSLAPTGR